MEIKQLKELARQRVNESQYDAKKLALIFTGASVALGFVMTLVSFLLNQQMEGTGGLGGMDTRAILSTVQMTVMIVGALAAPFWNLGYTRAALDTVRTGNAKPYTLLEGFRVFLPALRLFFLQAALIAVIMIVGVQAGTILYMLSPASTATMTVVEEMLAGGEAAFADPAIVEKLFKLFWPMYLLIGIVLLVALIPVLYRLRLVEFSLMDGQEKALKNMAWSNFRMRGKCFWMFKLDVSFWWYFLLQGLAVAVAYGDQLFGGGDVAYWVFYVLSTAAQLAIGWAFLPYVQSSYALAYDEITKDDKKGQV